MVKEAPLLLAVLFLGSNPVAVKYAVGQIPPLPFVALRFTLAGLLLLGLVCILSSESLPDRKDSLRMAWVGLVGVGLNNVGFTIGVSMTTASETALIYAAVPIWGMILASVLGIERPTRSGVIGVGIAIAGVCVIVGGDLGGGSSLLGDLLVVAATVCWGSYTVLSLQLLKEHSPLVVASLTMLCGGLGVVPVAFVTMILGVQVWGEVGSGVWAALFYSTVIVAAFGFWAWQRGISGVGANRALVYQYLITLVGVAAGVALLGERITIDKILGGAIILVGVYLARRR